MHVSLLCFQFLQYFIPKNAFAKGIAKASKGFTLAIDVLQVFELKIHVTLEQNLKTKICFNLLMVV